MPQSVEALPGNPEAIEYPEVELGIQDRFPSEVSESPGKDADDDKAGQLVQLYIAFVNQMVVTRPEILRGVRVWQLLRYLPSAWLRDDLDSLHSFSQQTTQFDQFWSHSWKGQRWSKYINILYLHNCLPASIAGSLSAGVACGLVSAGLLGARQRWCLLFGLVAFCITLLLWRPRKLVFLDIACIHQTDEGRKGEAIMSMGAFLKQSSSMLVLWDPTWVTRLWCVFEIAAFLHSRSPGSKADLQIIPPLLGPALLGFEMLFGICGIVYDYIESSLASSEDGILVGELHLMLIGVFVLLLGLATHLLRGYARSVEMLQDQLREFKVENTSSACCANCKKGESVLCDRAVILECIAAWYESLDSFELHVQSDVQLAVIDQLAYRAISYQRALLLFTPYVWLRLGYAASHASDPIRQLVDLAQTFTYFLAIYPVMAKLCLRLCYSLRARCCRLYIDFFLSMAVVIGAFLFYIACYAIQLYVFRQNDRELLLSVISMISWCTVGAVLWRII